MIFKHKQLVVWLATTIAAVGMLPFAFSTTRAHADNQSFTIQADQTTRSAEHVATGGLYGMYDGSTPSADLLSALKPKVFTQAPPGGQQIPNGEPTAGGDFTKVAPLAEQIGSKVVIRLADIYQKFPYNYTTEDDWLAKVKTMVTTAQKTYPNAIYGYELWNEANGTWKSKFGDFNKVWADTYNLVKSIDPNAVIIGPSYDVYGADKMTSFLKAAKESHTLPDVIAFHELSPDGAQAYTRDATSFRNVEDQLGIKHMKILINEYGTPQQLAVPGEMVKYMQAFEEDTDLDGACLAFWFNYGRMDNLITDTQKPNGGYWLYEWYGQMTGSMVKTDAANSGGLAAVADKESSGEISSVFGGTNGDTTVNVAGLAANTTAARITVQETPWYGVDTEVQQPKTIVSGTVAVQNGKVSVPVKGMNEYNGYHIVITPTSESVTGLTYKQRTTADLIRDEAETGNVTDGNVVTKRNSNIKLAQGALSYASNDGYVSDLNNADSSVEVTPNALAEGDYKVEIGYANGSNANGVFSAKLNGKTLDDAVFPNSGGWIGDVPDVKGNRKVIQYGTVHLNKGDNKFTLTHKSGSAQLDYVQFMPVNTGATTPGAGASSTPTGPSSSSSDSTSSSSASTVSSISSSSTTSSSSSSAIASSSSSTTAPSSPLVSVPKSAAKKGSVVYALKKLNLYKNVNFKMDNKLVTYAQQTRISRPMFVVTGYARSSSGALRYQVRDANPGSKTFGKKGYITAKTNYVQSIYYGSMPKSKTITVIAKKGINAYESANLTGKVKHYKKGVRLTVKKLVKRNLTTRYELSNGKYITANKTLIIAGNYS